MADEKDAKTPKESPLSKFRSQLRDKNALRETVLEGLKSTNAKVRSLAAKTAFKLKDHEIVKKNVLPLIKSDKSKKVLRAVSSKITRKDLVEKVRKLMVQKPKAAAVEAGAEGAAAAPAPAPEAKG